MIGSLCLLVAETINIRLKVWLFAITCILAVREIGVFTIAVSFVWVKGVIRVLGRCLWIFLLFTKVLQSALNNSLHHSVLIDPLYQTHFCLKVPRILLATSNWNVYYDWPSFLFTATLLRQVILVRVWALARWDGRAELFLFWKVYELVVDKACYHSDAED